MTKTYASKDLKRAIMVDDEQGIVKSFGLSNVLVCEPEGLIESEELEEVEASFDWTEWVWDYQYIKEKYHLSKIQISKMFDIPYRTVQNWDAGDRACPTYVVKMMDKILSNTF